MKKNKVENDTFLRNKVYIRGHFPLFGYVSKMASKRRIVYFINSRIYPDCQFLAKTKKLHLHLLIFQYVQAQRDKRYFYMLK
jgi:hypothetical protein